MEMKTTIAVSRIALKEYAQTLAADTMREIENKLLLTENLIRIEPGELLVSDKEIMTMTLLGSCVSVCLYDLINRIIGMNHYLSTDEYLHRNSNNSSLVGRVASQAMDLVIKKMLKLGAKRQFLKAKAFGGASVLKSYHRTGVNKQTDLWDIGPKNADYIKKYLKRAEIPLVSSDLGGTEGRMIYFDATDFSVLVRKVRNFRQISQ